MSAIRVEHFVWEDPARGRPLPLKAYWPEGDGPFPLVLFSHGLGGSREGGATWLTHWAAHGIAGLALQHPGSDETLFHGESRLALRRLLAAALTPEQLAARAADVAFVLDELARRADTADWRRIDRGRVGMSGHSFGAVTTQALAGERLQSHGTTLAEQRLKAFLALSPSARGEQEGLAERFGGIGRPFFSVTGSRDDGIGLTDITPENRRVPYRYMRGDGQGLLVLDGAGHLAFAGRAVEAGVEGRLERVHQDAARFAPAVCHASLLFWRAWLQDDPEARRAWSALADRLGPDDQFFFR